MTAIISHLHLSAPDRRMPDERTEWNPSPRRVRVMFNSRTIADSRRMFLLRQHGFLPIYYFPRDDVDEACLAACDWTTQSPYKGTARYFDVVAGERRAEAAAWTYPTTRAGSPDTRGTVGFDFHSMDAWFEEDEQIFVHARDPYLREETWTTTRHIQAFVDGLLVAESRQAVMLRETTKFERYYFPPGDVRLDLLRPSETYSMCPYKGRATYYDLHADDTIQRDICWTYRYPLPDIRRVAGHICFWMEKPAISFTVDGVTDPARARRPGSIPGSEMLGANQVFWSVLPPLAMADHPPNARQEAAVRPNGRAEGPLDTVMAGHDEPAGGPRILNLKPRSRRGANT
jgi:uncharacterized protein (DUF427 family)